MRFLGPGASSLLPGGSAFAISVLRVPRHAHSSLVVNMVAGGRVTFFGFNTVHDVLLYTVRQHGHAL